MYNIFNIPVNIDNHGSESHPHVAFTIYIPNLNHLYIEIKNRESSTTRQYLQPHERANSMLSFVQGRKLPRPDVSLSRIVHSLKKNQRLFTSRAKIHELNFFGQLNHLTKYCLLCPFPLVCNIFSIFHMSSSLTSTFCNSD